MKAMSKVPGGVIVIVVFVVALAVIYNKEELRTRLGGLLTPTDTITAEFAGQPKLREFRPGSDVKVAGVKVGTVTDVSAGAGGHTSVSMQVEDGLRDRLGTEPTATVRATLVLGGRYYVDLAPGGAPGPFTDDVIPAGRGTLPTELDDVLGAVGTAAGTTGIRSSIGQLDATLGQGGTRALQNLADNAPPALDPTAKVLDGLRGTRQGAEWTNTIVGLRNTAVALTSRANQTADLITTVNRATGALAAGSPALGNAVATMPETLRTSRAGLIDLQPALDQLTVTAHDFRDAASDFGPLFDKLDPAMDRARRVLDDARPLLEDAQPLVERLAPASGKATGVFDDLRGEVLDRVNGPIIHQLLSPYKGTGPYSGDGANGNKLYEELGFFGVRGAQDFGWHDKVGVVARVGAAAGSASFGSLVPSNEQRLEQLGLQKPDGAQADTPGPPKPLSVPKVPGVPNEVTPALPLPKPLGAPLTKITGGN